MLYHNIINTKIQRLSRNIIEQQTSYQIKGGNTKEFFEIGIDSQKIGKNGKQLIRKGVKRE